MEILKLKKRICPLVLIALLSMAAIVPAVFADAALTNERFKATGNYDIVAAGVGLQGVTSGEIDLNIPDSGTSVVVAAYLYWSGYNPNTGGDNEVYFQGAITGFYVDRYNPIVALQDKSASINGKPALTIINSLSLRFQTAPVQKQFARSLKP